MANFDKEKSFSGTGNLNWNILAADKLFGKIIVIFGETLDSLLNAFDRCNPIAVSRGEEAFFKVLFFNIHVPR